MRELDRISEQLRLAADGEAWHGPSLLENLAGVTAAIAAARPVRGAHSLWEVLQHLTAWNRAVARRLNGQAVELEGAADWPPVTGAAESAWQAAVQDFRDSLNDLRARMRSMGDEALAFPVANRNYDNCFMLNGVIQHYAYHSGQIALLKKAAAQLLTPHD